MTISDGFGDQCPAEDEFLSGSDGWVRGTVGRLIGSAHPAFDDVAQEARIELWQAYGELEEEPNRVAYSKQRAKRRMSQYLTRDNQTGSLREFRQVEVKTSAILDKPVGEGTTTLADLMVLADALGDVEWAYHDGEIMEALNALSPENREYVWRRFWLGYNDSEVARELGVSTSGMHNRWVRTIRPQLVAALAHLEGVS